MRSSTDRGAAATAATRQSASPDAGHEFVGLVLARNAVRDASLPRARRSDIARNLVLEHNGTADGWSHCLTMSSLFSSFKGGERPTHGALPRTCGLWMAYDAPCVGS
eukprot:433744-Prymnesium_polylepis.1